MDDNKYIEQQIQICQKHSFKEDLVDLDSLVALGKNFNPQVQIMA